MRTSLKAQVSQAHRDHELPASNAWTARAQWFFVGLLLQMIRLIAPAANDTVRPRKTESLPRVGHRLPASNPANDVPVPPMTAQLPCATDRHRRTLRDAIRRDRRSTYRMIDPTYTPPDERPTPVPPAPRKPRT